MQIGMVGLGRMGANMVLRLLAGGHECVVYDRDPGNAAPLLAAGAIAAGSVAELVAALKPPRPIWMMVPDPVVDAVLDELLDHVTAGDILIDGGNSYFPEDVRRAQRLDRKGIHYLDVGTSGGVWGRERGYCLMIGGEAEAVGRLEPLFRTLSPGMTAAPRSPGRGEKEDSVEQGYLHCGGHGAGHFVKMVHNGIEYGMMAAYSEGFAMLQKGTEQGVPLGAGYSAAPVELHARVGDIVELWRRGSVVGSWLLDLAATELHADPDLNAFSGEVSDSGEGRWTVKTATDMGVPAQVLTAALFQRFSSRGEAVYANKVLSALRHAFGGHEEKS